MQRINTFLFILILLADALFSHAEETRTERSDAPPNIVWIVVDDMSANFSCYGETAIRTPEVDKLAAQGIRFSNAYVTCPVCSPCRSALITGCYQTSIGAHHHRSGRGREKIHLPGQVEPVAALFQRAGYYTCIGGPLVADSANLGKTDYNFEWAESIYDGNDWSGRRPGQQFFMQVQLHGGKYRGHDQQKYDRWRAVVERQLGQTTSIEAVTLPPYYPRDPVILEDWALYLDAVRLTDLQVGQVINRLKDEGILESTVIFFLTDHGISHGRGKQFLYDEGLHIPLVIRGPGIAPAQVRTDLVQQIDLAPTSLALAHIPIPDGMQGRDLLAKDYQPREAVFAARDRCDETVDHIRAVRTGRYKYIRNYLPERPLLQPNAYKDGKVILQRLRELHAAGKLDDVAERLLFSATRPREELYDVTKDAHELHNLATDASYEQELQDMRDRLARWEQETRDRGRTSESEQMYDSDMAVYTREDRRSNPHKLSELEANIRLMKQWAKEGR